MKNIIIPKHVYSILILVFIFSCNKKEEEIRTKSSEINNSIPKIRNERETKNDPIKIDNLNIDNKFVIKEVEKENISKSTSHTIKSRGISPKESRKKIDTTNKSITPLSIPNNSVSNLNKSAIYPGCKDVASDSQSNCLTKNIHKELSQILISNSDFETEDEYERRAVIKFHITTDGYIELDQVNSSDSSFKQYVEKYFIIFAKRINSKENKIMPALDDNGNPTKMNFAIPIVFKFI